MERDYKVTYRTKEIDASEAPRYETRRRIPTALDPYLYPEDRDELKRNVALATTRAREKDYHEEDYESRVAMRQSNRPETTKTRYSVRSPGFDRDTQSIRSAARQADSPFQDREVRQLPIRSATRYQERDYAVENAYEIDRPRREGGGYVVDVSDAKVIEVRTGSGNYRSGRYDDDRRYERYTARSGRPRRSSSANGRREPRSSAPSLRDDGSYVRGARDAPTSRSHADLRNQYSRASTRRYDDETASQKIRQEPSRNTRRDEDEWGFIEKSTRNDETVIREEFRDPFEADRETQRGRRRADTRESENDFVMVSPQQAKEGRKSSLRPALVRDDAYTVEERIQRRRSRSLAFRDADTEGHYRGDKFCEQPGAEAAMMGKYLKSYGEEKERRVRRSRSHRREEVDERVDVKPARSRSRRRRHHAKEDDDQSYVSIHREKFIKDTYY